MKSVRAVYKLIRIYKARLDMELYIMFKSTLYTIVQLFTDSTIGLSSSHHQKLLEKVFH